MTKNEELKNLLLRLKKLVLNSTLKKKKKKERKNQSYALQEGSFSSKEQKLFQMLLVKCVVGLSLLSAHPKSYEHEQMEFEKEKEEGHQDKENAGETASDG